MSILAGLLCLLIFLFAVTTPHFLTLTNFRTIVANLWMIAIMGLGMSFVLLSGGIDISVGSVLGFTAVNVVLFHKLGLPAGAVVVAGLGVGVVLGAVNGLIITRLRMNPVITTLGMMAFARGMASWYATELEALKVARVLDENFQSIARYHLTLGLPLLPSVAIPIPITFVYVVALYGIGALVLGHTTWGRNIYAVGSNEYAARLAGINVNRIRMSCYILSAVMASLAGVILVAELSIGRDDAGLGSELEVITAVVLGGVSLFGGKGNLSGVIIAVLILGVIKNGMFHLEDVTGLSYHWRDVVKGAILIFAIWLDSLQQRARSERHVAR